MLMHKTTYQEIHLILSAGHKRICYAAVQGPSDLSDGAVYMKQAEDVHFVNA